MERTSKYDATKEIKAGEQLEVADSPERESDSRGRQKEEGQTGTEEPEWMERVRESSMKFGDRDICHVQGDQSR